MLHKISTPVLLAILLYNGYQYYKQWHLQQTVENYRLKKHPSIKVDHQKNSTAEPEIIKVTDEMYVAVGYALGNSIMLIGPTGVVIIDTTESLVAARQIAKEFRKITEKPVKGIIYTHNHADHVLGTEAFLENHPDRASVEVWAHHTLPLNFFHFMRVTGNAGYIRAMHQFGALLKTQQISSAIGHKLKIENIFPTFVSPNKLLYKEKQTIKLAGIDIALMHVPGETDDTICVYWPEKQALLGTDNLYKAFPNLYAIRGTTFRSLKQWYESLDKMRALRPKYFIMSHHKPLIGEDLVYKITTEYRDAVQLVHDQTVRFINQGMHPDEIAEAISLPETLRKNPYLKELYGTVRWSSKGLYSGYMGWFSGDISELDPLTPIERSKRLVSLVGGTENVLKASEKALNDDDPKWSLHLSSSVVNTEPENTKAKELKAKALFDMAERQTSFNGYNYYTTAAYVTLGTLKITPNKAKFKAAIEQSTITELFYLMALKFKTEECSHLDKIVLFEFSDTKQRVKFHIRNGLMDVSGIYRDAKEDLKVTINSVTWKSILTGEKSGLLAAVTSEIIAEPGISDLRVVMECFDRNV
jgi:alkyl sulfatase BDS1-like metallo-beta-lactamase superfamily hydrolase